FEDVAVTLLFFIPDVVPVTSTATVHVPLCARVAPVRLTEPLVVAGVPPHVLLRLGVLATTSPDGSVSVNPRPLSGDRSFGLVIVRVSLVEPPSRISDDANDLLITGAIGGSDQKSPVVQPLLEAYPGLQLPPVPFRKMVLHAPVDPEGRISWVKATL